MAATRAASCACSTTAIRSSGAVGIDIARESVARAELLKGHRPIEYKVADQAASARPHLRLRLQPRGALPAARPRRSTPRDMKAALRPGGAYVAAMGCHTDSSRVAALAQADRRDLVDPDLRPFARGRVQGLRRGGLHRGRAAARARRLHAGDGRQRLFPQGRRPAALLQPPTRCCSGSCARRESASPPSQPSMPVAGLRVRCCRSGDQLRCAADQHWRGCRARAAWACSPTSRKVCPASRCWSRRYAIAAAHSAGACCASPCSHDIGLASG